MNFDRAPKQNPQQENIEGAEKAEIIARAKEVYAELKPYDNEVVDAETNAKVKDLNGKLHITMMDERITWHDCIKAGLPWDPRFEMMKQAANNNGAPNVAKVS